MRSGVAPLLLLSLAACADRATVPDAGAVDGGAGDAASAAFACECEAEESCSGCMARLGECCYGDPGLPARDLLAPMAEAFARRCEADPACRACCNECAALDCEALIENNACPPIEPERPEANGNRLANLTALPATTEALAASPEAVQDALLNLGLYAFAVECALPEDAVVELSVDGETIELPGGLGFAPEWATGPCNEACQRWISTCMGARTNNWNVVARIFMRTSDHEAREVGRDGDRDPAPPERHVQEGAFYGNVFADPPRFYACRGEGRDPLYDVVRVCTHLDNHCGVIPVGPCLAPEDDPTAPHACEGVDEHGALRGCHSRLSSPDGAFGSAAVRYDEVSTLYIPETGFQAGLRAGGVCEATPPPGDHPPRPPPATLGAIGASCVNDDDCEASLICRVWEGPGHCTRGCTDADPAAEAAECGDGNTCLLFLDGNGYCVKSCVPLVVGGQGCGAGRVCTDQGLFSDGDDPGCANFCADDEDCLPSQRCGRQGICELELFAGPLEDRVPDGMPCDLDEGTNCRGVCIPFVGAKGICGSLIDQSKRFRCYDDPFSMPPISATATDDMGLCIFRRCTGTADCPEGLECVGEGPQARCTYDL